jgi:hypothetical protein
MSSIRAVSLFCNVVGSSYRPFLSISSCSSVLRFSECSVVSLFCVWSINRGFNAAWTQSVLRASTIRDSGVGRRATMEHSAGYPVSVLVISRSEISMDSMRGCFFLDTPSHVDGLYSKPPRFLSGFSHTSNFQKTWAPSLPFITTALGKPAKLP